MNKIKNFDIYIVSLVLIIFDQIIKICIKLNIDKMPIDFFYGMLRLNYCENEGAAFSIGNGNVLLFIIINVILIIGLIIFYERNKKNIKNLYKFFIILILSGGVSNLLDRIFRGYVIDFIDVNNIIKFAVFNIADIFIVVGVIGIMFEIMKSNIIEGEKK